MKIFCVFLVALVLSLPIRPVLSAGASPSVGPETGYPIPRFVSVRADRANLRTGPGRRYPIEWVLMRRDLPAEVVDEFEHWRQIRLPDGTVGWVHEQLIAGRRTALISSERRALRRAPGAAAAPVALLDPGVIAQLNGCEDEWCELEVGGIRGWLERTAFWGVYPDEEFD